MKFYTTVDIGRTRKETHDGFLVVEGVKVGRIGAMTYGANEMPKEFKANDDGVVIMSRTAHELFSDETIASFEGKPIIIPSGNVHAEGVNPQNWGDVAVGHMQNVRADDSRQFLLADLVINDNSAIQQVDAGLREVSLGYEYDAQQTSAGYGEQTKIRGNHVALVDKARGGSQLKIGDNLETKRADKIMATKNPFLRLFGHAAKADDEQAMADIERFMAGDAAPAVDPIAELTKQVAALTVLVKAGDKKRKSGDEDEDKDSAGDGASDEDEDEDEEDEANKKDVAADKKRKKSGDAAWQEVIAGAAVLAPHLTIERKGSIGDAKAKVLASTKGTSTNFIGDSVLVGNSLDVAFRAAVAVQKASNTSKVHAGDSSGLSGFEIIRGDK